MSRIIALAIKDLRLLIRDRFGMFWVIAFPLLMALFFGAIFSGGGSKAGSMKIGLVNDNGSQAALSFYESLAKSEVINEVWVTADSARKLVSQGKLTAYVYYKDSTSSITSLFEQDSGSAIEVGIDPTRRAEAGYLQGLISQAYFVQLQKQMTEPSNWIGPLDKQMAQIDSATNMSGKQRQLLGRFLGNLKEFLSTVDSSDTTVQKGVEENQPMLSGPKIEFNEVATERKGPRSSWEITFPQSLQWALIGVCAAFAISIVNERTKGTYLRLCLAPIGHAHILAGKGLACFIASVSVSALLLMFGIIIFGVKVSSVLHLILALFCSGICFVGIMMFISVLGKTEQSVGGAGWAILLVMSMTGGGMVPLFFMPKWMATIGHISAVKWSILALEGAIWRGLTLSEMLQPLFVLTGYGLLFFLTGLLIFKRYGRQI